MDDEVLIWSSFKCRRVLDPLERLPEQRNIKRIPFSRRQLRIMEEEMQRRELQQPSASTFHV